MKIPFVNKEKEEDIKSIRPTNVGWLEYKLNTQEMDYVWRCIKNKKHSVSHTLVGNISGSYDLVDRCDWFYTNTIVPLLYRYEKDFGNIGYDLPKHPYYMNRWWVNYQKQNEFNPVHHHTGVYSFVIWMKIPYFSEKQNLKDIARNSNHPQIGNFQFLYRNILGEGVSHGYSMSPKCEGIMLFFPSRLDHVVYPFYDCDETRISISGNISINTSKNL